MDSLREEIAQNLSENLTEHEVITEMVICTIDCVEPAHARQTESELSSVLAQSQPSVKVERITDRVMVRDRSARAEAKKEEVRVIRDTVYIEKRDSSFVKNTNGTNGTNRASPVAQTLKWVFGIIVAIGGLIIVIRVARLKI